jgi:hypothetical protein
MVRVPSYGGIEFRATVTPLEGKSPLIKYYNPRLHGARLDHTQVRQTSQLTIYSSSLQRGRER